MSSAAPDTTDAVVELAGGILPRGNHQLTREQVAGSQRARLIRAVTVLTAEAGFGAVTIGALARAARVSRRSFYDHFADKEACLLAAYDEFAGRLAQVVGDALGHGEEWDEFMEAALIAYLGSLDDDLPQARAFIVEMDAAGGAARRRRRETMRAFAELIAARHAALVEEDPSLVRLPARAYLGLALGIRELAHEELEAQARPQLRALVPDALALVGATFRGART